MMAPTDNQEGMSEQEAESSPSPGVNGLPRQKKESVQAAARERALCELELEGLKVCMEQEPKARRELLMAECRKWWHALLDKDKWIRDQDQGLVNKVVSAIQRRFPELSVPAIRAIIARSMRKAREKTKIATTKAYPGHPSEEDVPLSDLVRRDPSLVDPSKARLDLPANASPKEEVLRTTKLPHMSDSATSSAEGGPPQEEATSEGGRKRRAEPTPWPKSSRLRVRNETLEAENRSPVSGTTSDSDEVAPATIPGQLRMPYDIPPAPRFKGGPASLSSRVNYPPSTSYPSETRNNSRAAARSGRQELTDDFSAGLRAPTSSPPLATSLNGAGFRLTDEVKQRVCALEVRVRAQDAQLAQLQARESTWQAEKLGFEWHIQKLEQGELCARESIAQMRARAESLERELHMKQLTNSDLERQVRTLAHALRGSIQDRPSTPGFGDFHHIDQQNLLPALLMAYQKMYQGHVATAHMPQAEGEDQT